jgi:serine protease
MTLLSALILSGLVSAGTASSETTGPDPAITVTQAPAQERPAKAPRLEYDPHTVLVKFRGSASANARALRSRGAQRLGTIPDIGYVEVRGSVPAAELVKSLRTDKAVADVSLNYLRRKAASPNDPGYREGYQRYLGTVRMPQAWDITRAAHRQVVAVLDTGVDARHPDLAGRIVPGYNAVTPGGPTTDPDGHGTFVAGIIAANTNNGEGVAGVTWNGRVMPVRVFQGDTAADSHIVRGIIYAYSHGARIINMSLGGSEYSGPIRAAVREAVRRGVLVVASAGNTGAEEPHYPAAFPEVLAVGATDHSGALTDFSTWGEWVDLTAPGFDITSTYLRGEYWTGFDGTSFSAPIVAGVAALLRARYPSMTPGQVMGRLKATARDAGPRGIDPFYGHGFLDAYHVLGGRWAPELHLNSLGEANDVPARATPIPASNTARGTFLMEGDIDWYRFDAARPVTIRVWPPAFDPRRPQNVDPVLVVYDAELRSRGFADRNGLGGPEEFSLDITTGPTYIAVYNYAGARDGRAYTLTVNPGPALARDPGGQLWIRSVWPADFGGLVPLTAKPTVTFQRDVVSTSVTASTVRLLHGTTGAAVPSTVTYDPGTKTATISPSAPLQDNTPYRISVRGVRDAVETLGYEQWSTFRTVNLAPGPVSGFDAFGWSPGAARLAWRLPNISDLDQVVVRRAAGNTPPSGAHLGTPVYAGTGSGTIAVGLADGTSYAFAAWVRDRTGRWSAPATTRLVGTRLGTAAIPGTVTYGGATTLHGRLTRSGDGAAVAGQKIHLYGRQKGTTAWRLAGSFTTNANGAASFTYQPSVGRDYQWAYNGSVDLVGSRSAIRAVTVRPVVTANVSRPSISLGNSVLVYGSVAPNHPGQYVFLQRLLPSGWSHVTTTRLTSQSTYMFGLEPTARGSYAYRVVRPADADHLLAISPTRTFRVT